MSFFDELKRDVYKVAVAHLVGGRVALSFR
jgi:hypothetical protein